MNKKFSAYSKYPQKAFLLFWLYALFWTSESAAQENMKSHISSDKMFILKYPQNWKVNKLESSNAELTINAPGANLFSICMVKVEINKMAEGYENADIHQLSEVELKMLKAQPEQQMNLEVLQSSFKKMNDHEWWVISGTAANAGKVYYTDSYKTIHNQKVYVFTYFSNEKNYEKNKDGFEKIITSIEFLTRNNETPVAKANTGNSSDDRVNNSGTDDRINNSLPVIGETPFWSIATATGWMKNFEGQWIEGNNKIQKHFMSLAETHKWTQGINATGWDNFINMEVREVKIGGKAFIVIIKSMLDGEYRYKHNPDSWEPIKRYKYFVIRKNSVQPKPTIEKDGSVQYGLQIYFNGYVPYDKNYLHNIALKISEGDHEDPEMKNVGSTSGITLYYKELNDGKKCRFMLTRSGGGYSEDGPYDPTPQYREPWSGSMPLGYPNFYYECEKSAITGLLNVIGKR